MKDPNLSSLHPLHYADQHYNRFSKHYGSHGSFYLNLPHVSRSPELSRAYQVGDPIRLIDWKAFARNDQLIVREERNEAMASVVVVLDGRDTMFWPDASVEKERHESVPTKFSFATRIALHLVHRHIRLGDRVRLVVLGNKFSEKEVSAIELRSPFEVLSLFEGLEKKNFDLSNLQSYLRPHSLFFSRTNLLFWISDCCSGEIPVEYFDQSQNCFVFHTLSFLEVDPSWLREKTCYFDESMSEKEFLGQALKRNDYYVQKIKSWCAKLKTTVETHRGSYMLFTDKSSIRSYVAALDSLSR